MKEIPPYQTVDILLQKVEPDKSPQRGWYISIADQQGRDAMPSRFAYNEEERDQLYLKAQEVSKYSVRTHRAWIHKGTGREYWSPR